VHGKVHYRGVLLVNGKLKQPPDGLCRADISTVKVLTNFVVIVQELYSYAVVPLVDILINILYSLYGGAGLNINIGPILCAMIRIIRYHIAVIKVYGSTVTAQYTDRPRP
jgi:hypothetical protein